MHYHHLSLLLFVLGASALSCGQQQRLLLQLDAAVYLQLPEKM
jgi:hypothetical protein